MNLIINSSKYGIFTVKIDDSDYEMVSKYVWHINIREGNKRPTAVTNIYLGNGKQTAIQMHRLIMGDDRRYQVDHINGDNLDNRRSNLRYCTPSQNSANRKAHQANKTSKYRGVYFCKRSKKFRSAIYKNGKKYNLGRFEDEIEAAKTYDFAALTLFGEFAITNNLLSQNQNSNMSSTRETAYLSIASKQQKGKTQCQ